jgi:hypothetical protein
MGNGVPQYPLENPKHAIALLVFGICFFLIGTAIRLMATHKDRVFLEKDTKVLTPTFWSWYGGGGRVGQWIGLVIAFSGLIALIVSSFEKSS